MAKKKPSRSNVGSTRSSAESNNSAKLPDPTAPDPRAPYTAATRLTDDERAFLDFFLVHRNATRAFRETYPHLAYQTANGEGPALIDRPHVRAEYLAMRAAQSRRLGITADNAMREIARIAFSDPLDLVDDGGAPRQLRHIPYDLRRAIASVEVSQDTVSVTSRGRTRTKRTGRTTKIKLWNKLDALDKLFKHLGLQTEIPPLDALLNLLPDEVRNRVREALSERRNQTAPVSSSNGHDTHED